jgi:hypothetical protein
MHVPGTHYPQAKCTNFYDTHGNLVRQVREGAGRKPIEIRFSPKDKKE